MDTNLSCNCTLIGSALPTLQIATSVTSTTSTIFQLDVDQLHIIRHPWSFYIVGPSNVYCTTGAPSSSSRNIVTPHFIRIHPGETLVTHTSVSQYCHFTEPAGHYTIYINAPLEMFALGPIDPSTEPTGTYQCTTSCSVVLTKPDTTETQLVGETIFQEEF